MFLIKFLWDRYRVMATIEWQGPSDHTQFLGAQIYTLTTARAHNSDVITSRTVKAVL